MTASGSRFAIDVPNAVLLQLQQGDRTAQAQVYRWFEGPVFTLALRICGNRDQASEVLQETMLKALGAVSGFRGRNNEGDVPFWAWLRQIAVNESLMLLRRQRHHTFENAELGDFEPIDERTPPPHLAADAAMLQRALAALPANTRAVLWLYHAEGYTHEQIATLMQRTPSFSKSQLARGLRRLRALLEPTSQSSAADAACEALYG